MSTCGQHTELRSRVPVLTRELILCFMRPIWVTVIESGFQTSAKANMIFFFFFAFVKHVGQEVSFFFFFLEAVGSLKCSVKTFAVLCARCEK